MAYQGVGIVLYSPDMGSILMIRDSRSMKWSFPKGHTEDYDAFPLATGIREMYEETRFTYLQDYVVNFHTSKIYGKYLLYEGVSLHMNLILKHNFEEYVDKVAWIPIVKLLSLRNRVMSVDMYLKEHTRSK